MASKAYQTLEPHYDTKLHEKKLYSSTLQHLIKDCFSIQTWIFFGALLQGGLLITLKLSYALLPLVLYSIYTTLYLLWAAASPAKANRYVTYHRTTALLPDNEGEFRAGTAGETIATLHLGFKNYSKLGPAAPGFSTLYQYAQEMIADLETDEGRRKYGYLGSEAFLSMLTPVDTSASLLMLVMYFRSIDCVHEYSQSPLHRKAWDWYDNFSKGVEMERKYLGIMHEVFEAKPGKWETIYKNMERVGLGRGVAITDDGSLLGTVVDAAKGTLARAKGRVS